MKTQTLFCWAVGLVLVALPLVGLSQLARDLSEAPATANTTTNQELYSEAGAATDSPSTAVTQQDLENAPGQIVSVASAPPANVTLTTPANEVVKLAQAGVDDSVMLAYVTNSPYSFQLTSDDIIYLGDMGVSDTVVTAMLERDQLVRSATLTAAAPVSPPVYENQPGVAAGAEAQYADDNNTAAQVSADQPVAQDQVPADGNVSSGYFYDSLAPYGTWIDIAGYGMCWQPTVVVANRGWQPYCDRGHWMYSDCGWYWDSDYSWGWAPFHYGRWFRHNRWGWCWAPDTVWGPSWVSWRYSNDYCGWAPLPPWAIFTPGIGFTFNGGFVGLNFGFGLSASYYTFVPIGHFNDRHPHRFRMPAQSVDLVFNRTRPRNEIFQGRNHMVVNAGVPVDRIAAATRSQIRPVHINGVDNLALAGASRNHREAGRALTVYRPNLPQPDHSTALVGEGVKPAPRNDIRRPVQAGARNSAPGFGAVRQPVGNFNSTSPGSSPQTVPVFRNNPPALGRADSRPNNGVTTRVFNAANSPRQTPPMILGGADRGTAAVNGRGNQTANTWAASDPNDAVRSRGFAQPMPAQNRSDWQNQRVFSQPNNRQFIQPAAPVQRPVPAQPYQWSRPVEPRQDQPRFNPSFNRPAPAARSDPGNYSAPRGDFRQAPAQSAPSRNQGSGGGNSRRNN